MSVSLEALLGQKRLLEKEPIREARKKKAEFCYEVHEEAVHFTEVARAMHKQLRLSVHRYLLDSSFLVLLTAPVIWMCLIPIALLDLICSIYQAVCFPIYGIPKVDRPEYLAFNHHHLTYLNFIEKLNCEYCAYGNGILAYFTEIAARTEQHWCPIKHAGCAKCAHSRYKEFVDFGDAEKYRQHIEEIRRSYQDIESPEIPT